MPGFFNWGRDEASASPVPESDDKVIRLLAELENVRRRARREGEEAARRERVAILTSLLDVVDNFDRALAAPGAEDNAWLHGMTGVREQLVELLQRHGAREFLSEGEPFDPNRHEAVSLLDHGGDTERVGEVLQPGYEWEDGSILRPARVIVVRGD